MGTIDAQSSDSVVIGYRWPTIQDLVITLDVRDAARVPEGAEGWTWTLRVSTRREGGDPEMQLDCEVSVVEEIISLTTHATAEDTAAVSRPHESAHYPLYADVISTDGDADVRLWASFELTGRAPAGGPE